MSSEVSMEERDLLLQLHHSIREMLLQDTLDARLHVAAQICRDWGWGYVGIILYGDTTPAIEMRRDDQTTADRPALPEAAITNFWLGRYQFMYLKYRKGDGYLIPVSAATNSEYQYSENVWHPGIMLVFPIHSNAGQMVGLLTLSAPSDGKFPDASAMEVLELFVAQFGAIIQHSQTLEDQSGLAVELQHKVEELVMLERVDQELNANVFNFENVMSLTMDWALRRTGAATGLLGLVTPDGSGMIPLISLGIPLDKIEEYSAGNPLPLTKGIVGRAARTKEMQIVRDVHSDPDYIDLMSGSTSAEVAVPMIRRGQVLGVISLESEQEDGFDNIDLSFLTRLAARAVVALDNARLYEEAERRADEMASLYAASRAISASLEREEILTSTAQALASLLKASGTIMATYQPNRGQFIVEKVYRLGTARSVPDILPSIGEAFKIEDIPELNELVQKGQTHQANSIEPGGVALQTFMRSRNYRSLLIAPLSVQGQVLGLTMVVDGRRDRLFSRDEILIAESLANQAGAALRQAALFQDVRELENIKSEMIRMASHDLRSPLGSALNYLELLMMVIEVTLGLKHQDYVTIMRRSMLEMKTLIEELLNLEQLESERQSAWVTFDLSQLVRDVVETQQADAYLKRQSLTLDIDDTGGPFRVLGSHIQLRQAVTNLVNNAIKYTPEGGKIQTRLCRQKDGLKFEVEDNGYGIPKERQKRLFQRFYRARQAGTEHIPGTGLGLSLVKTVIDRHGGELWVQSEQGAGSTFGFWLPDAPKV